MVKKNKQISDKKSTPLASSFVLCLIYKSQLKAPEKTYLFKLVVFGEQALTYFEFVENLFALFNIIKYWDTVYYRGTAEVQWN